MRISQDPPYAQINLKLSPCKTNIQQGEPGQRNINNSNLSSPVSRAYNNITPSYSFQNVAIYSKRANKVFDISQEQKKKGVLIIYQDLNQSNQRFDILDCNGYVKIISKQSGKALTVQGNSEKNGSAICEETLSEVIGQKFRLAAVENGEYFIHTFCGKVLDCCQQKTSNGTTIIQWDCDRKEHQKWLIR